MFSKGSKSSKDAHRGVPSIISADAKLIGDIVSEGEVQIDGQVAGDIQCHTLVVGESGAITGACVAEITRVHGAITGSITSRSVYLAKTARMIGDITHESLAIEPGALMQGHCGRIEDEEAVATPAAAKPVEVPTSSPPAPLALADKREKETPEMKEAV
ncbi:MAG: polymer-forming cytoskeletal protein [Alphaproteobacteria bacterium]|nr:polymer-forming cytoskeletal protein [Alphaproteobacteria bacterium]